jgi:hypothetical protein
MQPSGRGFLGSESRGATLIPQAHPAILLRLMADHRCGIAARCELHRISTDLETGETLDRVVEVNLQARPSQIETMVIEGTKGGEKRGGHQPRRAQLLCLGFASLPGRLHSRRPWQPRKTLTADRLATKHPVR